MTWNLAVVYGTAEQENLEVGRLGTYTPHLEISRYRFQYLWIPGHKTP